MVKKYKIQNVNVKFIKLVKSNERYRDLSFSKATGRMADDILEGKFEDQQTKARMNEITNKIEEAIYGKKKKNNIV